MTKRSLILLATLMLPLCSMPFAANKALLIGISDYKGERFDLEGPQHDVTALKATLQAHWGFKYKNIKTLLNYDANRETILKALTELKNNAQASDHIFIYFSGHGTSVHNKEFRLPLPYSSGALVPQDFSNTGTPEQMMRQLIIGKRDLKPILSALDKTQAETFVVFDSCYSGNTVRGLYAQANRLPTRQMPLNISTRDGYSDYDDKEVTEYDVASQSTEAYPYQNIFFLSAANAREVAIDINTIHLNQFPTQDGKAHGAFTDTLIRALSGNLNTDINHDGKITYTELYTSIHTFMQQRGYSHSPQVLPQLEEDNQRLRMHRVLGKQEVSEPVQQPHPSLLSLYINAKNPNLLNQLRQLPHIKISDQAAELNLYQTGNNYRLINQSGDLIGTLNTPSIQQIIGRIEQEVWKKLFRQQLQKRASINIDFSLKNSLTGNTAIEHEYIAFTLRSENPLYLLLLNVDTFGSLAVLYPQRQHELQGIPAHQITYIPGKNPKDLIQVKAPFGTDHLIAIGFNKKPDFLKEFIETDNLNLHSILYKKLYQHLKTTVYGYRELDLITMPASTLK